MIYPSLLVRQDQPHIQRPSTCNYMYTTSQVLALTDQYLWDSKKAAHIYTPHRKVWGVYRPTPKVCGVKTKEKAAGRSATRHCKMPCALFSISSAHFFRKCDPEKTRSEKGRFSRRKTQKRKKAHAAFSDRKMRTRARVRAHTRA